MRENGISGSSSSSSSSSAELELLTFFSSPLGADCLERILENFWFVLSSRNSFLVKDDKEDVERWKTIPCFALSLRSNVTSITKTNKIMRQALERCDNSLLQYPTNWVALKLSGQAWLRSRSRKESGVFGWSRIPRNTGSLIESFLTPNS